METRICILLLSLVALECSGCALFHRQAKPSTDDSAQASPDSDVNSPPPSVIEPQVERRTVTVPTIRPSNIELGAYYGEISIQDFGAQPVAGLRFVFLGLLVHPRLPLLLCLAVVGVLLAAWRWPHDYVDGQVRARPGRLGRKASVQGPDRPVIDPDDGIRWGGG